ncbi:serine protease gd-like [Tribolium madens]|uniref:serine protease gd-like n=1 Tax=Tribolium madens TaxID=41895 RepID=UPI001CF74C3E|nr:serine protease gd-like [Tribolium madens]XP_044261136.1 serine protease gd-like [Tribolium madens]
MHIERLLTFLLYFVTTRAMVVRPQLYSSPCPDTFQYEMTQNGQLYGTIGVYSFDENVVRLNVELSVGNRVNSYNGEIQLANPKELIFDDIHHQRPIRYKVFFPRWENTPPRVTKIMVNGQVVCSGPPIQMNNWARVLTKINLEHTLTIKVSPLRSQSGPFVPSRNNPFLSGRETEKANPFLDTKINTKPVRNQFLDDFPVTVRTTTEKINRSSGPSNEILFVGNPFLNGKTTLAPSHKTPSRDSSPADDTCGVSIVANPLVINGNTVPRGAFPWLTAIFAVTTTGLEYKCSGSLVSQRHVVTAAHCVQEGRKRAQPDRFLFVLGKLNIKKWSLAEGEKMVEAEDIQIHPDYVPLTSDADIAVVILAEKIEFSKYIRPICLWSEPDDIDVIVGQKGKVVGWGRDEQDNLMTAEPKQANIPIVSQEECLRSSEAFKYITSERTFCAGERNESGPCNGDSGSGFIMKRNGKWSLRGVVSISTYDPIKQSCDLTNYVVFTDVSKFRSWLLAIVVI